MSDLNFPAYGSICTSDTTIGISSTNVALDDDYFIGPHCGNVYWDKRREITSTVWWSQITARVSLPIQYKLSSKSSSTMKGLDLTAYVAGLLDTGLITVAIHSICK